MHAGSSEGGEKGGSLRRAANSKNSCFQSKFIRFRLLVAYLGLLGYMLLTPSPPGTGGNDLVGHAGAFGLLGMLIWWNLPTGPWREVIAMLVAGAIGAATELGQGMVPGRSMSVADGAADLLGAGLGVAVMAVMGTRRVASSQVAQPT